jgi:hypothetical protein
MGMNVEHAEGLRGQEILPAKKISLIKIGRTIGGVGKVRGFQCG